MSSSFKPVPVDLHETLARAVAHGDALRSLAHDAVDRGLDDVFLVGCGGSLCATYAAHYTLETRAPTLGVFQMTSAEFTARRPARLGPRSLVLLGSHSGSTAETLAALELARERGAGTIIGVSSDDESPLARGVDAAFCYGSENVVWPPKQIIQQFLAYGLLEAIGVSADYDGARAALHASPGAIVDTVERYEPVLHGIAERLHDEVVTYVLAAGPNYGAAYGLAMCYLQEMQWMHAAAFNAGEFFHGALEIVTDEVPVLVLLGEDSTRPLAERALAFVQRYSSKAVAVDTTEFPLPGVPQQHRQVVTPIVLITLIARLAAHYADVRDHAMTLRRYMTKVAY